MKLFKDIRIYLIIILSILCILATVQFAISVLPIKILILVILVFAFLVTFFSALVYQRNKAFRYIGMLLLVVFIAIGGYGNYMLNKTMGVLNKIVSNDANTVRYSIITLNENVKDPDIDPSLHDLSAYGNESYGIVMVGNTANNSDVIKAIDEDAGQTPEYVTLRSIQEATEAFKNGDVKMLILNESLRSMFEEDLDAISTVVAEYSFEVVSKDIRTEAQVTEEPFIIYITGVDVYGDLSEQGRSDVNKIMMVDPIDKKIVLIDIPRDYYVPQTCQYDQEDKLTHSGFFGVDCTVSSIEEFMDIDINYYVKVNFSSLVDIVDALGGIDVYSDYTFDTHKAAAGYHFDEGWNHLSGMEALMFSRERYAFIDGDNQRIKNQTAVLKAIIDKVASPAIITNYMSFMDVMAQTIQTNLNEDEIYALIQMQLTDMASWEIESYALEGYGAILWSPAGNADLWVMQPDYNTIEEAKELIADFMNKNTDSLE